MVFLPLINNIALLVTLSILYNLIARKWDYKTYQHRLLAGLLFGVVTIAGMMNPLKLMPGVIFDGRSIILSVGGLFGGPITAAISAVISGAYRIYLGGAGTTMGVSVITTSALIGVGYHYLRERYPSSVRTGFLYLFGLVVHINMLILTATLPSSISKEVLQTIALAVLTLYPLGSLLVCIMFLQQESRLKAIRSLKESEENYRILVEKASSIILKLDRLGRIVFINSFAEKELGYRSEELIGRFAAGNIISTRDIPFRDFTEMIEELFHRPETHSMFETEVICKSGERKWVSWTYKIIHDDNDKNLLEVLCVGNDVTLKKKAELALVESEKKYRSLHESLMDGFVRIDMDGFIVESNRSYQEFTGYSPEELRKLRYQDLTPPKWHAFEQSIVQQEVLLMGYSRTYEKEYIRKDGTIIPIELRTYLITDENAKPTGMWAIVRDITERKKAEKTIKDNEKRLRSILRAAPVGIGVVKNRVILEVNDRLCEITGYARDELINQNARILYTSDEEYSYVGTEKYRQIDERGIGTVETTWRRKDGRVINIILSSSPQDVSDLAKGVTFSALDVTELKEIEQELQEESAKLKDIIEFNPISIQVVDKDGYTLKVNQAYTRLFGGTPAAGHTIFNDPIIQSSGLLNELLRVKQGEVVNIPEFKYNAHDVFPDQPDNPIWLKLIAFPLFNSRRRVDQVILMHEDISHRKLADQAIAQSEAKFRSMVELAVDAILIGNSSGVIIDANQKAVELTGYPPDELVGKSINLLFSEEELRKVPFRYDLLKEGRAVRNERLLTRSDGSTVQIEMNTKLMPDNTYQTFIRDVSERVKSERKIRENELKFRTLFETSNDSIFLMDNGTIVDCNQKACEIFACSKTDLIGHTLHEFFPERQPDGRLSAERADELIRETLAGNSQFFEWAHTTKGGSPFDAEVSLNRFEIDGKVFIQAIVRDVTERKKADIALKQSEMLHRNLVANSPMGMHFYALDPNDALIFAGANPAADKLLGIDHSLLVGKPLEEAFPGLAGTEVPSRYKEAAINGITWEAEQIAYTDSRIEGAFELRAFQTSYRKMVAVFMDISERVKAQEALRESEKRFRTVITRTPVVFFTTDRNGVFTLSEGQGLTLLGLKPGEVVGLSVFDVYKDYPLIQECIRNALGGNEVRSDLHVGSCTFDTIVSPIISEKNEIDGVIGVATDITVRKIAEVALKEKTDELDRYFTGSLDLLCIADTNGYFRRLNPEWERTLGYSIDELIGTKFLDYVHPDDLKGTLEAISTLSRQQSILNFVNRYRCKDQSYRWIEWRSYPSGNLIYAVARDITERKLAEERLIENEKLLKQQNEEYLAINEELNESNQRIREMNEKLIRATEKAQESDRLKSAFLANMSHEIRTPMNGIIGFCDLLQRENLKKEQIDTYVGIIVRSSNQLLSIINDIIDISKIEAGQVTLNPTTFHPQRVIEEIGDLFSANASSKGLHLDVRMQNNDMPAISADQTKIKQVLSNLVNNAIKFTDKGTIEIGCQVEAGYLQFYVKDQGIGIAPENHQYIFERFRQVEGANTNSMAGTGLGLAISKSLIEMMGGIIWVESELGKGATFRFTIPMVVTPVALAEESKASNTDGYMDLTGKTILIAEDEQTNRLYLQSLLERTRVRVVEAQNGLEAVAAIKASLPIDLILMDIKMPLMDGEQAARKIKSINPTIPIIAQTAYALPDEQEKIMASGFDGYITKPINPIELFRQVMKYLAD